MNHKTKLSIGNAVDDADVVVISMEVRVSSQWFLSVARIILSAMGLQVLKAPPLPQIQCDQTPVIGHDADEHGASET